MLVKLIFYGFLFYVLYKLIFELIIPVGKATSQVKDRMREMQEQQREQYQQQQQQQYQQQQQAQQSSPVSKGDYIDFEEIN